MKKGKQKSETIMYIKMYSFVNIKLQDILNIQLLIEDEVINRD